MYVRTIVDVPAGTQLTVCHTQVRSVGLGWASIGWVGGEVERWDSSLLWLHLYPT